MGGATEASGTAHEMQILFQTLPTELQDFLSRTYTSDHLMHLNEIYLQLGQVPECIFADPQTGATVRQLMGGERGEKCEEGHIALFYKFFSPDADGTISMKRKGIEHTLHRISIISHPSSKPERPIGVAIRVGRAMQGLVQTMVWESFLHELAHKKHSLLLIGRPGVGYVYLMNIQEFAQPFNLFRSPIIIHADHHATAKQRYSARLLASFPMI